MSSDQSATSRPLIYYTLIAFNTNIICEVNEYNDNTTIETKKEKKYIRASKKILKKIEQYEIRRPDGMGTLISGTYSYNYIHGYEYCNNTNYPLLESLIFLCVLPLYQSNPNITSSEREIAFNFLSSIRRDFLTSFAENLRYIYNHQNISTLAVRIHGFHPNNHTYDQLCLEDENISTNLYKLSHVMVQRMHGNYATTFDYMSENHTLDQGEQQPDNDAEAQAQAQTQTQQPKQEEESEYINIGMENSSNNEGNGPGYGAICHPLSVEEDNTSQRSVINSLMDSLVDVKQQMKGRIASLSSLKSFGTTNTVSDDRFEDYETRPLLSSTTALLSGEYENNSQTSSGFVGRVGRHKRKIAIILTVLIVIYAIIAMFCGLGFDSCTSK